MADTVGARRVDIIHKTGASLNEIAEPAGKACSPASFGSLPAHPQVVHHKHRYRSQRILLQWRQSIPGLFIQHEKTAQIDIPLGCQGSSSEKAEVGIFFNEGKVFVALIFGHVVHN